MSIAADLVSGANNFGKEISKQSEFADQPGEVKEVQFIKLLGKALKLGDETSDGEISKVEGLNLDKLSLENLLEEIENNPKQEASLLFLLYNLGVLEIESPEEGNNAQLGYDSLMTLLEKFDVQNQNNLSFKGENSISSSDDSLTEILEEFVQTDSTDIALSDLKSDGNILELVTEILSEDNGEALLQKINSEFPAEVRAMQIYADSQNDSSRSLLERLSFADKEIVFMAKESPENISETGRSISSSDILAANSRNQLEQEQYNMAKNIKPSSTTFQLNSSELIGSEVIDDFNFKVETNDSSNKLDNLFSLMMAGNVDGDFELEDTGSELIEDDSFEQILAGLPDATKGSETNEIDRSFTKSALDNPVMEQVLDKMGELKQVNSNQLEMELEPAWLGKLKINITVEQGEVMARFLVDNSFVRHELENHLGILKNSLARQGFNIEQITINSRDQQPGWQEGEGQSAYEEQSGLDYNQEDANFAFTDEEYNYYADQLDEPGSFTLNKMSSGLKRWLSMKQYYYGMNYLA